MRKFYWIILLLLVTIVACKKKTTEPIPAPSKAKLLTPDSNSTCTTGRIISATDNAVTFTWNSAANASSYALTIKNLLSGSISTQNTNATTIEVVLLRNTPYSWFIVSKSDKTTATAQSSVWKFYNSGLATTSHPPFPADLTMPTFGQSLNATAGKVTLTWTGSAVDNNIVGYDVYLGTTSANMAVIKPDLTTSTFDATVTSGTTYYWKIVTKDSQGNTSSSGTYQFNVN